MKKNILLGFAACGAMLLSANVASAQETVVIEEATLTATDVECADHYYVEKGSGWFLQLGAGINAPFVDSADKNGDKTLTSQPLTTSASVNGLHRTWLGVCLATMASST